MYRIKDVDVIILTYNRKEFLLQTLNKLEQQTNKNFNVIITDDGTKDPINPSQYPIIDKYIWAKDDGYHRVGALNSAIDLCVSENIIILDDDCIPQSTKFIEQHVINLQNYAISRGIIQFPSDNYADANAWFSTANIGLKTHVMRNVGKFDKNLDGHYGHDDQVLSFELKKSGFTASPYHIDTLVYHIGENYANNDRSWDVIGHNTQYCIDKYGVDPRKPIPW